MKTLLSLITVFAAVFGAAAPSAFAYNGYVQDVRFGEHPYETRKRDENRRKRLDDDREKYGYYRFDNPVYFHPMFAQRSVLHPFYRKGGVSIYTDNRFVRWNGYQDPTLAQVLSPSSTCMNYTYQRSGYRSQPQPAQCF